MLNSHRLVNKQVQLHRKKLRSLNKEEGLNYCIKTYQVKLSFMRSWIYHDQKDDAVLIVKFEDLTTSPVDEFKKIFGHCGFSISKNFLKEILDDYSKDKMRKKDIKSRANFRSNYSTTNSNWQKEFTKQNIDLFQKINGNLIKLLGYNRKENNIHNEKK